LIGRFVWSPDDEQWGDAARLAVADPDCDIELKLVSDENIQKLGVRRQQNRIVDKAGRELGQDESHSRIFPFVVPHLGVDFYLLPEPLVPFEIPDAPDPRA